MIGLATSALMPPTSIVYGIAVGMSIAVMLLAGRLHPPAAANASLAFHTMPTAWKFLAIVVVGASFIAIIAHFARNLGADAGLSLAASGEVRGETFSE